VTQPSDRAPIERSHLRSASDHLALVHRRGHGQVLCRLRDLAEGGARICLSPGDTAPVGTALEVVLLEAGLSGADLTINGRIAWVSGGELGLRWEALPGESLRALRRLLLACDTRALSMVG
jgi:hypothetical protein